MRIIFYNIFFYFIYYLLNFLHPIIKVRLLQIETYAIGHMSQSIEIHLSEKKLNFGCFQDEYMGVTKLWRLLNIDKTPNKHTFWMKNTYIPLDVIYFDKDSNVIGFIENNLPHDLTIKGINKSSKSFLLFKEWRKRISISEYGANSFLPKPPVATIEHLKFLLFFFNSKK